MWRKKLLFPIRNYIYAVRGSTRRSVHISIKNAFGKHLLFTNTWTSGALMVAGDLMEQEIEYRRKLIPERYDWWRVGRMFITGLAFGPLHHYFYMWLDKALPQRTLKVITQKILWDQIVMSPVCIAVFIYGVSALEGKSLRSGTDELKEKFVDIYAFDWCIWPPTQFINFYYLPVKYQVLYINGVTMIYNVFLSYIKHKNVENV
ncbi:hypothetical protein PPYR_08279 [Photinus pyralis]|uniref:Mpv17-like protein 2 n=1 Tax=Photinus pyralis TaxID=7054 RepID=A0A1Y1L3P9_PHOPY|nr:mpv17-like protein 2 [Photinus pyralis]XP_031349777.1 mpv17-like protein 2 [Photinus pyralis]KAB0795196.1 hypothetical protein PPYR_12035 [Photinus pyralis]KAB0797285.1 hypothetical protein PPYR_08279 [Photinus pyralis]